MLSCGTWRVGELLMDARSWPRFYLGMLPSRIALGERPEAYFALRPHVLGLRSR